MAEHLLLLAHGMGKPKDGWDADWKKLLADTYATYAPAGQSFEDQFECRAITYDSAFEARRNSWNAAIDEILASPAIAGLQLPDAGTLKSLTADNFLGTHVLDVLLYRFSPVAQQVRAMVVQQLRDAVRGDWTRVSILAHSLGTSVVSDSINALYNTKDPDTGQLLDPQDFRFETIVFLANVSRLLETETDVYDDTIVRPGLNPIGSACECMLSAGHAWDPIVAPKRFAPVQTWPDPPTRADGRLALCAPDLIQQWNVHDVSHYIRDPFVHIPLFRLLRHDKWITKQAETDAIDAFRTSTPQAKFDDYRKQLKEIIVGEADFSWKKFFSILDGFRKLVNQFAGK